MDSSLRLAGVLLAAAAPFACQPLANGPDAGGPDTTTTDVSEYNALEQKLSTNAKVLVASDEDPSSPGAVGSQLFYLEFPSDMPTVPTLHRYDDGTHKTLDYTFGIGTTDQGTPYNWNASASIVTTVDPSQDTPVLTAYAANDPKTVVGALTLPAPPDGEIFQANAVDGNDVYYIDDGSSDPVLVKWAAGPVTTTTTVLTFSKVGVDARSPQSFTVTGTMLLLLDEMGGLWNIDIAAPKATFLGNKTEATGGSYDSSGFLYTTGSGTSTGLFYYDFSTDKTTDVAGAIAASAYSLNTTYSMIHYYSSGAALANGVVYYIGEGNGLYSFTLATKTVTPLLLAPQDDSVEYQSPIILDDGTLVVLGIDTNNPGPGSATLYTVTH
jgi:hypothetical protein